MGVRQGRLKQIKRDVARRRSLTKAVLAEAFVNCIFLRMKGTAMSSKITLRNPEELARETAQWRHVFGKDGRILCDTEHRGHRTPKNMAPLDLVLTRTEGFIPLWEKGTTLHWRFQERAIRALSNRVEVMTEVRNLFAAAVLDWGSAAPVKFSEDQNLWDFEIVIRNADYGNDSNAGVLASGFFPDAGRHEFVVYPLLFEQSPKEQKDTFIHETGHIFGLRHFFADVDETAWPVEVFGVRNRFTIMNYGFESELTDIDKGDLRRLYAAAWSGALSNINGAPIRFVKPYHLSGVPAESMMTVQHVHAATLPRAAVGYPNGA
jgi:hypothetical protein